MASRDLAAAQRGIALAEAFGPRARPARRRGRRGTAARGRGALTGPLLSPGSLTASERLRLIDGIQTVLEGVFTHLPLKRARYGVDPVQRLCILRTQIAELSDDAFHNEVADIVTRLRDAHTRYVGPAALEDKVAALPFLVEMIGSAEQPAYVVTKVGRGLAAPFRPGVILEDWNGVPIDVAVLRHADREVGGRPDSQRAWAVQSLTLRSLQYGPPPDELWVVVGYRTANVAGTAGPRKEITIPWRVVDAGEIAPLLSGGPSGARAKALRRTRAVNPAAEAVRRAKMLLFAPHALAGKQARAPQAAGQGKPSKQAGSTIIPTRLTETLKAMTIDAAGGPFGYLRIYAFDAEPEPFLRELIRLLPLFPDRGLIIDVRGNPGGYIWAAELALQLFTPKRIEPTRFSALATPFTRRIAAIAGVSEDLAPWRPSLDAAVRNGELYSQPIPITDPAMCNELGQHYGGPVVLVGDSTTYSSGDLFSAGFVDNAIGRFVCVGAATGAGGANVWEYGELRKALAGSPVVLPPLPEGIDLTFSFRRATRARSMEGIPIEDVGVAGAPYAMTKEDLLHGNVDLIAACTGLLRKQPFSRLAAALDRRARTIRVSAAGLDRVDVYVDEHPASASVMLGSGGDATVPYPANAAEIELRGFSGSALLQRRRIETRA